MFKMQLSTSCVLATLATLAALLLPGTTPVRAQAATPTQLLGNPGLDDPYTTLPTPTGKAQITGAVANGWTDDSAWADVTVAYAEVKDGVHGGSAAQSITVQSIRTGYGQFAQWLTVTPHHSYALSVWVKGKTGESVTVALRLAPAPYTTLGQTKATLTGAWQQVTVSADSQDAPRAGFMIYPPTGSTLLIDDASLTDVGASK